MQHPEETMANQYVPDRQIVTCSLCGELFERPITLPCGHSFCHHCLIASLTSKRAEGSELKSLSMIPLCPQCKGIIWR